VDKLYYGLFIKECANSVVFRYWRRSYAKHGASKASSFEEKYLCISNNSLMPIISGRAGYLRKGGILRIEEFLTA
jgi:hypothetical protein